MKGSKILFEDLFCFLFVNIQASCCLGEREVVSSCTRLGRLALGLRAHPSACLLASRFCGRGLRHGVFCRKALTAGWWMTNQAAFSGAAKLRLSRGRLELGALAGGSPARRLWVTVPPGWSRRRTLTMVSCLCFSCGQPWSSGCGWLGWPCWLPSSCVPALSLGSARGPGGCRPPLWSCHAGT